MCPFIGGLMAGRKRSIRFKIFAILLVPLTAVVVIWGFAAAITVQSGLELLRVSTVYDNIVTPTRNLLGEVARERFLSAVHLADTTAPRSQIDIQRQETDM